MPFSNKRNGNTDTYQGKKGGRQKRNSDPSLSGSKVPTIIYSFTYLLKFYLKAKMMLVVHSL